MLREQARDVLRGHVPLDEVVPYHGRVAGLRGGRYPEVALHRSHVGDVLDRDRVTLVPHVVDPLLTAAAGRRLVDVHDLWIGLDRMSAEREGRDEHERT